MDILTEVADLNPFDIIRSRIGLAPKEPLEPLKAGVA
jgi:hypothetical protein